jgi:mycothiol synthase
VLFLASRPSAIAVHWEGPYEVPDKRGPNAGEMDRWIVSDNIEPVLSIETAKVHHMTAGPDDRLVPVTDAPDIDGLRFRRPRRDDADYAALATLMGRAAAADAVPWRPTPANIRQEHESSPERMDPAADVIVAEIDGRIVGEAEVDRVVREGVVVFHVNGHVDPDVRRRGIGRALLGANIDRARARAQLEPADLPIELGGFAEESEVGHGALLETNGFGRIRWFFLMRRDLGDPIDDIPLPDGLELRPVEPQHHRAIFDAEEEAFRDHWGHREKSEADLTMTYAREEFDPALWVVAWDGDEIAGVVQNWIWATENAEMGVARGWLEHISVRSPWRRRGLARAITAESLRRIRAAGMTDAMLGVDSENLTGALGLYEGLGFSVYSRSSAYRRALSRT